MSHTDEPIICPNCGSEARGNYCYQCGQETHLHKETFWGMVMHFIGHYFHYDSKFWMTMKALWTKPGKLTLAYIDKQRMRYIPPISLYIFISAVYFLIGFSLKNGTIFPIKEGKINYVRKLADHLDSLGTAQLNDSTDEVTEGEDKKKNKQYGFSWGLDTSNEGSAVKTISTYDSAAHDGKQKEDTSNALGRFFERKFEKIEKEHHGKMKEYTQEKTRHTLPKIFFFMIPILALILRVLFLRRKSVSFVDHAVFAIHYHALWFSLWLITNIGISNKITVVSKLIFYTGAFVYMVAAIRKVYKSSRIKAIFYTFLVAIAYGICFALVSTLVGVIIVAIE